MTRHAAASAPMAEERALRSTIPLLPAAAAASEATSAAVAVVAAAAAAADDDDEATVDICARNLAFPLRITSIASACARRRRAAKLSPAPDAVEAALRIDDPIILVSSFNIDSLSRISISSSFALDDAARAARHCLNLVRI